MKRSNRILAVVVSVALMFSLSIEIVQAETATHSFGTGGTGATAISVYNPHYGQNTSIGPTINNHKLTYGGSTYDAFCMDPFLNNGSTYTLVNTYDDQGGIGADFEYAKKYIAMYLEGHPYGDYNEIQRKTAAQLAIFDVSSISAYDYRWISRIFNGSPYWDAYNDFCAEAQSYIMPPTEASLPEPDNISDVTLSYNADRDEYTATINAGSVAQYYSWQGYATRSGNNITFTVPAADVEAWDVSASRGMKTYTSEPVNGTGAPQSILDIKVWSAGNSYQQLLTGSYQSVRPTNSVQYTLYAPGLDEGMPGGGGGYYGGNSSDAKAIAGGGSGYISGSGTTVDGSAAITAPYGGAETGHSGHGYARIQYVGD